MTVYVLAQMTITAPSRYNRYRDAFLPTLKPFNGRLLVADPNPRIVEGDWDAHKVILIEFDTEDLFRAWVQSPEYRRISVDRRAGAMGPVLLLQRVGAV